MNKLERNKKNKERFQNFLTEYRTIQRLLGKEANFTVKTLNYKEKLTDKKENVEEIKQVLNKNETTLLIAPAGTGKTYTVINSLKELDNEDYINIITVPGRNQALQIAEEYGIKAIVGGSLNLINYNLNQEKVFVCVYDVLKTVKEDLKLNNTYKVRLVLDEAHNLASQASFRTKAISNIEYFEEYVLENKGSVVNMTATYNVMSYKKFDNILNFEQKNGYKVKTKTFNLYYNNKNENYNNFVYNIIKNKNSLVRYNNIDFTDLLISNLQIKDNKVVYFYNSQEKGSFIDSTGKNKYYNNFTNEAINNSKIPECDIAFTTSGMDCGINFVDVINKDKQEFEATFCVQDFLNLDLMNIEQFFNRLRFNCKAYNLILNAPKTEILDFKELEEIILEDLEEIKTNMKYFNMSLEALKFKYTKNDILDEIGLRKEIETQFSYETLEGKRNDLNCIVLTDNLEIDYNNKKFFYDCYKKFNKQYYNNIYNFVEALEIIFNIDINIIKDTDMENTILDDSVENYVNKILKEILKDNELLNEIRTKNYKNEDILKIQNTKMFNEIKELVELGQDVKDAINNVLNLDKKELEELKKDLVKEQIKTLTNAEIRTLDEIIKGNKKISSIIYAKTTKTKMINIINSNFYKDLKKSNNLKCDINDTITAILNDNISEFLNNRQYINNNILYSENEKYLTGRAGKEQKFIINLLEKEYNIIKRTKLTNKNLEDIANKLNKEFNTTKYTTTKTKNLLLKIFDIKFVEYNNNKIEEINGLKLK